MMSDSYIENYSMPSRSNLHFYNFCHSGAKCPCQKLQM